MKLLLTIIIAFITNTSIAHEKDLKINTPAEARAWCKNKSIEYFSEKNFTPYDWSSSWWNKGNIINIKGIWKVEDTEYIVKCRIKKGLKDKSAVITINEKTLTIK